MPAFAGHTTGRADFPHPAFRQTSQQTHGGSARLNTGQAARAKFADNDLHGETRVRRPPNSGSRRLTSLASAPTARSLLVWLQFHVAIHTVQFWTQHFIWKPSFHHERGDRMSSFPSDTATLFFGLAAVVFVEQRLVGLFCFVWVAVIIAIPRVIFGFHYASDIIGSLVLASVCVFIFAKIPYPRRLFERTLMLFEGRMYIVHALLFVFWWKRPTCS
jgi:membrane-associated phospholipid phosphatase